MSSTTITALITNLQSQIETNNKSIADAQSTIQNMTGTNANLAQANIDLQNAINALNAINQ